MITTHIQLTPEQSQTLNLISQEKGISVTELIQYSISYYLQSIRQHTLTEKQLRALSVIGQFSADVDNLSTDHDVYLAQAYGDFEE